MANISKEERQRRELAAKHEAGEIIENERFPVEPTSELAEKPVTPAAQALPMGTPGHADVDNAKENAEAAARVVNPAIKEVPQAKVRLKRGYFPVGGGAKLAEGSEVTLPMPDARYLIEAGIAEYIAHFPEV